MKTQRVSAATHLSPATAVNAAVTDIRLEKFLRLRVAHSRQLEVNAELWRLMTCAQHEREITVLVGPTGVGKTNLIETIESEADSRFVASGSPVGRIAHLRINAAPPQNDTFRFPSLYREVLTASDDYFSQRSRLGRLRTSDELQAAAVNVLRHRGPIVFTIDEAQHVTYAVRQQRLAQHIDNLKWLADQIQSPILLVGTGELLKFSLISAQLARRLNQVPFLPYRAVSADIAAFLGVVKTLMEAMPVHSDFDLSKHRAFFFDGSAGSVGLLKQWFARVVEDAITAGRNSATLADFERLRMPIGKLTLIANEYAKIMADLQLLQGSAAALRQALGYPTLTAAAPATTPTASTTPTPTAAPTSATTASPAPAPLPLPAPAVSESVSARARKRRPGERALGRDPVGDAA